MAESGEDAIGSVQNFSGGLQAPSNAVNFMTGDAPRTSAQQPYVSRPRDKTINAAISKKLVQATPKMQSKNAVRKRSPKMQSGK